MNIRRAAALSGALCTLLGGALAASAQASSHDYCFWDGSFSSNTAGTLCFANGTNVLTNNHAYLPFAPGSPTIYCGAHLNGSPYAGYTSGNPSCDHAYGAGNSLKADEYVSTAATTHGTITW
jgi:hypothetical protein